jgi:hypothetical protein
MYHSFIDDSGNKYGSFEVFEVNQSNVLDFAIDQFGKTYYGSVDTDLKPSEITGHYWQSCFPGCLPDSDPIGPFTTESDAIADATEV